MQMDSRLKLVLIINWINDLKINKGIMIGIAPNDATHSRSIRNGQHTPDH